MSTYDQTPVVFGFLSLASLAQHDDSHSIHSWAARLIPQLAIVNTAVINVDVHVSFLYVGLYSLGLCTSVVYQGH
jgi:hypothetical protein